MAVFERNEHSFESDWYSLGIVVYVLLAGYLPPSIVRMQPDMSVLNRQPGMDLISQEAKEFVLELLRREPSKRLSGELVLQHPWFRHKAFNVNTAVLRSMSEALKPLSVSINV